MTEQRFAKEMVSTNTIAEIKLRTNKKINKCNWDDFKKVIENLYQERNKDLKYTENLNKIYTTMLTRKIDPNHNFDYTIIEKLEKEERTKLFDTIQKTIEQNIQLIKQNKRMLIEIGKHLRLKLEKELFGDLPEYEKENEKVENYKKEIINKLRQLSNKINNKKYNETTKTIIKNEIDDIMILFEMIDETKNTTYNFIDSKLKKKLDERIFLTIKKWINEEKEKQIEKLKSYIPKI